LKFSQYISHVIFKWKVAKKSLRTVIKNHKKFNNDEAICFPTPFWKIKIHLRKWILRFHQSFYGKLSLNKQFVNDAQFCLQHFCRFRNSYAIIFNIIYLICNGSGQGSWKWLEKCWKVRYKVCHGFRWMKQDDYFWVNFDHFCIKQYFWKQLEQFWKLARA